VSFQPLNNATDAHAHTRAHTHKHTLINIPHLCIQNV